MERFRCALLVVVLTLLPLSQVFPQWYNSAWHYRLPVTVAANGHARTDKPVEIDLNFTTYLSGAGPFNQNSLRVIEVTSGGTMLDTNVIFQFNRSATYNDSTNASGTLIFIMSGTTGSGASRYYHIYFDHGPDFTAKSFSNQIGVTTAFWEGQNSYRVATPLAVYYYHIQGAGFASMIDNNGNDWLSYHPTGGSAGSYRGIPNMGDWAHPGYTNGTSTLEYQGPIHARVYSQTIDGAYKAYWDFFPQYVRMTLTARGGNYWLLYEGTPNGQFNDTDYMVKQTGGRFTLNQTVEGNFQWAYFGDPATQRTLYMIHHEVDAEPDGHRPMEGNMTVFGFGRQPTPSNTIRWMTAVPQTMTFGFAEDSLFAASTIEAAFRPLGVTVGNLESTGLNISNIQVLRGVTSAVISWTTNKSATTIFEYGLTTGYGTTLTDTSLKTQHSVVLTGLTSSTLYNYKITNTDTGSVAATTGNRTFTTRGAFQTSGIQSDAFNSGALNGSLWTIVNPLGDATIGTNGSQLAITVPAGTTHDLWGDNKNAPRILQNCNNTDFDIEAKFDTPIGGQFQLQGFIVQQDAQNFIRFDFVSTGTSLRVFAASFVGGSPTTRIDLGTALINTAPLYLRVLRSENTFSLLFSTNGTSWTTAGSFSHVLTVSSVGLFAGNAGNNPGYTALIDYFNNRAYVKVQAKALLQGAYDATGDSMRCNLTPNLPLSQPYNSAPWNYAGTETVTSFPAGTVDWVLLELRFAPDSASIVKRRAALLRRDGVITDLDGNALVHVDDVAAGSYYLLLRHRNHLGVMSSTAAAMNEASALFDFTISASTAYGSSSQAALGNGRYGLYAGDANASGIITAADANAVFSVLNLVGYSAADANLSGIVTSADANTVFQNLNKSTNIP